MPSTTENYHCRTESSSSKMSSFSEMPEIPQRSLGMVSSMLDRKKVYPYEANGVSISTSNSSSSYSGVPIQRGSTLMTKMSRDEKENLGTSPRPSSQTMAETDRPIDGRVGLGLQTGQDGSYYDSGDLIVDRKTNTKYMKGKLLGEVCVMN
jgi:hypothetical protein